MNREKSLKQISVQIVLFLYLIIIFLVQNSTLNMNRSLSSIPGQAHNVFLFACLLFAIFFNKYKIKDLILISLISLPLIVVQIKTGNSPLLELLIIVVGLKSLPLDSILKSVFFSQLISFIMILGLRYLKIIPDRAVIRDGLLRYSMGFWHPNTAGMSLVIIFLLALFLFQEKKYTTMIVCNILNVFMFRQTDSRTSFILLILGTVLTILEVEFSKRQKKFLNYRYLIPMVYAIFMSGSFILSDLYSTGNTFILELSRLLSNRLSLGNTFIKEYGLSVFGKAIQYRSSNYLTQEVIGFQYRVLDNIYLKYLLNYGFISAVLLFIYISAIASKLHDKYLNKWNMYFLLFLIFGILEQSAFSISMNFFMYFGVILIESRINKEFLKQGKIMED